MQSNNKFLNSLFNNLSSVYPNNDGMLNSNLFIIFNAYASVLSNIENFADDTADNTYLNTANVDVLEDNFGSYVDFSKPPRLNTVTDGGEIYRAILRSIYDAFLNGSTEESMDTGLSTVLSFLTIDNDTSPVIVENNNVFFNTFDRSIQLAYPATTSSGTVALPADITISPSGYVTVDRYDSTNQTIYFNGTLPTSGLACVITYYRDHSYQTNTNWINLTNTSGTSPLPTDLKTVENTYRNPKFSYWWNTYNRDGNGIQIIDGTLSNSDCGLVWRLPEKYIRFIDPYTKNITKSTIELYNFAGGIYDINSPDKNTNPDVIQSTKILSYVDEVPRVPNNFYIRYGDNNIAFTGLAPFAGGMNQVEKISDVSVDFKSNNFGQLDFFQKGPRFDINNLFSDGTENIWLNVENKNGLYSLSNENFFDRPFSLHEDILFKEFFENGNYSLANFPIISGASMLADTVGTPLQSSQDCLMLYGSSTSVYPNISGHILASGNRIDVDIYDASASGTKASILINLINPLDNSISGVTTFNFVINYKDVSAPVSVVGPNGYSVRNTIPYSYIDTRFANIDEMNYAVKSAVGLKLVPGNTDSSSAYHLETSGNGSVTPNLTSLQDIDGFEFEISSDKAFSITSNQVSLTGGVPQYHNTRQISLGYQISPPAFWGSSAYSTATPTVGGGYFTYGGGGGGYITDFNSVLTSSPATFKVKITKSSVTINGVSSNNYNQMFGSSSYVLGYNNPPSGPNYYAPNSLTLNVSSGSKVYSYSNGNLKNNSFNTNSNAAYYYQIAYSGADINQTPQNYLGISEDAGWHRFSFDLGSGMNHLSASLDSYNFLNIPLGYSGNFGFVDDLNNPKAITLNHSSLYPTEEFSYFDNFKFTYYTPTEIRPKYQYIEDPIQDWQGSYLDQSAVLSNRTFKGTRQGNYVFELIIKGLENKFLYIIKDLVDKLKPAHTMTEISVQTDNILNTTSLISQYVLDERNWETGNIRDNIQITEDIDTEDVLDLAGAIRPSGS